MAQNQKMIEISVKVSVIQNDIEIRISYLKCVKERKRLKVLLLFSWNFLIRFSTKISC